jgi:hypothetical protein
MEKGFQALAEGILAVTDRRDGEALAFLSTALAIFEEELSNIPWNLLGMQSLVAGYRALALSRSNELAEADRTLRPYESLLAAAEPELLAEVRRAAGASPFR